MAQPCRYWKCQRFHGLAPLRCSVNMELALHHLTLIVVRIVKANDVSHMKFKLANELGCRGDGQSFIDNEEQLGRNMRPIDNLKAQ